jgi:hypothetical protein
LVKRPLNQLATDRLNRRGLGDGNEVFTTDTGKAFSDLAERSYSTMNYRQWIVRDPGLLVERQFSRVRE